MLANTIALIHNTHLRAECHDDFDECDCFPVAHAILAKAKGETK